MSDLQTRLQTAADEAARLGRSPGPARHPARTSAATAPDRRDGLADRPDAGGGERWVPAGSPADRPRSPRPPRAPADGRRPGPAAVTAGHPPRRGSPRWAVQGADPSGWCATWHGQISRVEARPAGPGPSVGAGARGEAGCWPPRSRFQGRTGSVGRTASSAVGGSLSAGHGGSKDRLKLLQASELGEPPSAVRASWRWWLAPSPDKRSGCGSCSGTDRRSTWCLSSLDPSSRLSSTPCSTCNRPERPGCPNAWSPTTRRAAASLSAMPRLARATSVIAPPRRPPQP